MVFVYFFLAGALLLSRKKKHLPKEAMLLAFGAGILILGLFVYHSLSPAGIEI